MDENLDSAAQEEPVLEEDVPPAFPIKKVVSLVVGIVVVLIVLFIVFVVVIPKLSPKKPQDVTLTYWGLWEDTSPLVALATEFTKENPHIKVNIEKQDIKSLGKYIDRLKTRMSQGTGPDVFRFSNSWVLEVSPLLLPLPQDVVKSTELDSKFFPVVARDLKINGAYYGVPIHFDTLALFVNTQIFKENGIDTYPSTWEDLYPLALKLTVKDSTDGKITTSGIAMGTYDNVSHAPDIISLLMAQNGANPKNLSASRQASVQALDFYTSLAKGETQVWNATMDNSTLAFAKGNVAMYIGYSWDIFQIKAVNPDLQFAVLPAPRVAGGNEATIASYWVEGVSSSTKYPKEAFEFLKFLTSKNSMQQLYSQESKVRLFGELPPRKDLADSLSSNTLIYPFVSQGKNATSTIFASDTHDDAMVDGLNAYLGNAIRSIILDNSSSDTALDTLIAGQNQIISKNAGK